VRCNIQKYIYCFNKYKYYLCRFSDSSERDNLGFGIVVGLSKHVMWFESDVTNQTDYVRRRRNIRRDEEEVLLSLFVQHIVRVDAGR